MIIDPVTLIVALIIASTPVLLAAIGELVVEKTGVLNLGVEGMMIMGAVTGFIVAVETNPSFLRSSRDGRWHDPRCHLRGPDAGSFVEPGRDGAGADALSGWASRHFWAWAIPARPCRRSRRLSRRQCRRSPLSGPILFSHTALIYLAVILVAAIWYVLSYTRTGLVLRAVGESHDAAHALGYKVIRIRILAILFGGACAGLGGAFLSVARVQNWIEGMTAGAGWIALALVVFASWKPWRVLFGAYLFRWHLGVAAAPAGGGGERARRASGQLPYLVTIIVLVLISSDRARAALNAPAALGKVFHASG
jgi:ABC-type uncharacterized transport system permease subunit